MVAGIATAKPINRAAPVQPRSKVGSTRAVNTAAKTNKMATWGDPNGQLPCHIHDYVAGIARRRIATIGGGRAVRAGYGAEGHCPQQAAEQRQQHRLPP
jgi:hypothetical protein